MGNGDFVRYIVIFRGSFFSFSYMFPTSPLTGPRCPNRTPRALRFT
uniref:Uncharacterized protein n=1 Tax=Myoviridae sp. ctOyc4 TaxID=2827606 RepID=A0A8S5LQJ9_9CAUD|nr:MAG TPA: hypothetical protein [Myoviridae sp. ctOyc4]